MNKAELIDAISNDASLSKADAKRAVKVEIAKAEIITEEKERGLIPFNVYFSLLRSKNPKIMGHHKVPLRAFCDKILGKGMHTREQFEEAIKKY